MQRYLLNESMSRKEILDTYKKFIKTRLLTNFELLNKNMNVNALIDLNTIYGFNKETVYMMLDKGLTIEQIKNDVRDEIDSIIDLISFDPEIDKTSISPFDINIFINKPRGCFYKDIETPTSGSINTRPAKYTIDKYWFTQIPYIDIELYRKYMKKLDNVMYDSATIINTDQLLKSDIFQRNLRIEDFNSNPENISNYFSRDYSSSIFKNSNEDLTIKFNEYMIELCNEYVNAVLTEGKFIFEDLFERSYKKVLNSCIKFNDDYIKNNLPEDENQVYKIITSTINNQEYGSYGISEILMGFKNMSKYENAEVIKAMFKYYKKINPEISLSEFIKYYIHSTVGYIYDTLFKRNDGTYGNDYIIEDSYITKILFNNIFLFISNLIKITSIIKNNDNNYKRMILDHIYNAININISTKPLVDFTKDSLFSKFNSVRSIHSIIKYEDNSYNYIYSYNTSLLKSYLQKQEYQFLLEPINKFLVKAINNSEATKNTALLNYLFESNKSRYNKLHFNKNSVVGGIYMLALNYNYNDYKSSVRSKILNGMI